MKALKLKLIKCRYIDICKLAKPPSIVCLHGGGPYCGHYRALCSIERGSTKNRKQRKEQLKNYEKKREIL